VVADEGGSVRVVHEQRVQLAVARAVDDAEIPAAGTHDLAVGQPAIGDAVLE
jgi:hypothetical protein